MSPLRPALAFSRVCPSSPASSHTLPLGPPSFKYRQEGQVVNAACDPTSLGTHTDLNARAHALLAQRLYPRRVTVHVSVEARAGGHPVPSSCSPPCCLERKALTEPEVHSFC